MNRASTVLFALAVTTTVAHAQKPSERAAAEAALAEGRRLYDLQEWEQAIAKFKESYRLRADAPALFNIAQAYRLKGDCAQAAGFYKTYKRNFPKEKNLARVEKFITEMEACAKAAGATPGTDTATPATDATTPATDSTDPQPSASGGGAGGALASSPRPGTRGDLQSVSAPAVPSPSSIESAPSEGGSGRGLRITGLVVASLGAVALGTGVYYGLEARSAASDADDLAPGTTWDPSIETRGERAEKRATYLLIGGGVAVLAGSALYLLGAPKRNTHSLAVVPARGGATIAWGWSL